MGRGREGVLQFRATPFRVPISTEDMTMENALQYSIDKDGILTVKMDLKASGTVSASGKSTVVASTHGNTPIAYNGQVFKLGVNCFKSK